MTTQINPSRQEFGKWLHIPVGDVVLTGNLVLPDKTKSLVIFSHGSSSRFSPLNNFVAQLFQKRNIGTLQVYLLTDQEDTQHAIRFDIDLLTERLVEITRSVARFGETSSLSFGYFGSGTGAASALKAAALLPQSIAAVVLRGGRPDLAQNALSKVKAPTLFIVGEFDHEVLRLNQEAYDKLECEKELLVVADAGHLFEEPGALEDASLLAAIWFEKHLIRKDSIKKSI